MKRRMRNLVWAVSLLPLLGSGTAIAAPLMPAVMHNSNNYVHMVQATDPRLTQLQEQVRDLNGRLEELNFQILQMQEQMRKVQEENEYRFDELEKQKRSDSGVKPSGTQAATDSQAGDTTLAEASSDASATNAPTGTASSEQVPTAPTKQMTDSMAIGSPENPHAQPPRALGSIRFDVNGNVIGETLNTEAASQQVASLPPTDNPMELYQGAYQFILAGDYRVAEVAFRSHIERFPDDPMAADAYYWLGEALYGQERYAEAASVFIDMQRDFPQSKYGAENMLKLGLSMAKLDDRQTACATLDKIAERYPTAAAAVLKRAVDERKKLSC